MPATPLNWISTWRLLEIFHQFQLFTSARDCVVPRFHFFDLLVMTWPQRWPELSVSRRRLRKQTLVLVDASSQRETLARWWNLKGNGTSVANVTPSFVSYWHFYPVTSLGNFESAIFWALIIWPSLPVNTEAGQAAHGLTWSPCTCIQIHFCLQSNVQREDNLSYISTPDTRLWTSPRLKTCIWSFVYSLKRRWWRHIIATRLS